MTDTHVQDRPQKARRRRSSELARYGVHGCVGHLRSKSSRRNGRFVLSCPVPRGAQARPVRAATSLLPRRWIVRGRHRRLRSAEDLDELVAKAPRRSSGHYHFAANITDVDAVLDGVVDFDIVFFDTAPSVEDHLDEMKKLLVPADLVIVPTKQSEDDLDSVLPWMNCPEALPTQLLLPAQRGEA